MTIQIFYTDKRPPLLLRFVQTMKQVQRDAVETSTFGNGPVVQQNVRCIDIVSLED